MKDKASLTSGAIFVAIGCVYGATAMMTLPIGSAISMGPGYFPTALSGLLVVLGAAIIARSFYGEDSNAFEHIPWRAILMISLASICFAVFIRALGLFPTVLLTAFLSCLSNDQVSPWKAAILGVAMAVLCTLIFHFGVGLPVPTFGSWLGGFI